MNAQVTRNQCDLKVHLEKLSTSKECSLTKEIATIILDQASDDLKPFFTDLFQHGCVSGMVGDLVYYADTYAFYDRHYAAIEAMREEHEDETGEPLILQGDLKNFYAWFSFELIAFRIASDMGW